MVSVGVQSRLAALATNLRLLGVNGLGWVVGSWAATGLGWAAVTLLAVCYTGLVRQQ